MLDHVFLSFMFSVVKECSFHVVFSSHLLIKRDGSALCKSCIP